MSDDFAYLLTLSIIANLERGQQQRDFIKSAVKKLDNNQPLTSEESAACYDCAMLGLITAVEVRHEMINSPIPKADQKRSQQNVTSN